MLGHGASGHTWRAAHVDDGRVVAIKELSFRRLTELKQLDLFRREAETLKALHHRGVPSYEEDFVVEEDRYVSFYLVQELIDGEALRVDGGTTEEEVRRLLREMAEILIYLDTRRPRVIHRDIKPSNIMRRSDGSFALIDFGSTRAVAGGTVGGSTVAGTLGYMAPEQLMGRAEVASDIYGLGATAVALLAGRDASGIIDPHRPGSWKRHADVSGALEALLDEMLCVDLERRLDDPKQLARRLDELDHPTTAPEGAAAKEASLAAVQSSLAPAQDASLRAIAIRISRDPVAQSTWIGLLAVACVGLFWVAMMISAFLPEELRASLPRPTMSWAFLALGLIVTAYVGLFLVGARLDRVEDASAAVQSVLRLRRLRHVLRTTYRSAGPVRFALIALFVVLWAVVPGALSEHLTGSFGLGVAIGAGLILLDQVQAHLRRRNGWHRALYPEFDEVWPREGEARPVFHKLANQLWCGTPGFMAKSHAREAFQKSYAALKQLRAAGLNRRQREQVDLVLLTCHAAFADRDRLEESLRSLDVMQPRHATAQALLAASDAADTDEKAHELAALYLEHRRASSHPRPVT